MINLERILIIGMTQNHGGIESYIINTYKKINKEIYQYDFVNMWKNKIAEQDFFERRGCKVYNIPNEYKSPIKCYKQLKQIIINNKYNIVYINKNSLCSSIVLKAVKNSNVPIRIIHSHNTKSTGGILGNILHEHNRKKISNYCNYFFACTEKAGEWMFNPEIIGSSRYYVINNAIDLDKFIFNYKIRNRLRNKLNISKDTIVIGHVGRFEKQKNHDFLVEIFNEVHKRNKKTILILVGKGSLEEKIKEKVKTLKLNDSVKFLGAREDVNELYQIFDVFCLPSLYEGLPLVGIEAQASDLPCIFSNNMSLKVKMLEKAYFLSNLSSPEEWADLILKNYGERKNNKVIMQKNNYDIECETIKLEKMYKSFIEKEIKCNE